MERLLLIILLAALTFLWVIGRIEFPTGTELRARRECYLACKEPCFKTYYCPSSRPEKPAAD